MKAILVFMKLRYQLPWQFELFWLPSPHTSSPRQTNILLHNCCIREDYPLYSFHNF